VFNPYGIPTTAILGNFPGTDWYVSDPFGRDEYGIWVTESWIEVYVPNTGDTAPGTWKEIILQMTHDAGALYNYVARISTDPDAKELTLLEATLLPSGYMYARWGITIEPNPTGETIYIQPSFCSLYVDEIVVDTICIPEPATIALLGLGGLILLKRRR